MIMCNVKGVTCSDQPKEDFFPTLQLPSTIWSILASFSSLFWFYSAQLYCFVSLSLLIYLVSIKWLTGKVSD